MNSLRKYELSKGAQGLAFFGIALLLLSDPNTSAWFSSILESGWPSLAFGIGIALVLFGVSMYCPTTCRRCRKIGWTPKRRVIESDGTEWLCATCR